MDDERDRIARRRATFVRDAHQRLATLSASLLTLERDPTDQAAREAALRALHTLKGNAGFVDLEALAATAHALEDALANALSLPPAALLVRGLDVLSAMVAVLAEVVHQPVPPIPAVEALAAASGEHRLAESQVAYRDTRAAPAEGPLPEVAAVSVGHLDDLLALVEELRIAHSDLAQGPYSGVRLERGLARQRRLLHELHDSVLQTRLLPVGRALDGFERLVRDLAESLGRQAQLRIEGADTEIDRSALEPVRELMVHLLRNALVHGLEPPGERLSAGKAAVGTVRIVARAEGDGVVLEVTDDGRGLERQKLAERAVALGLCAPDQAATMEDEQLWAFLARPGFSTHERVDRVSGRGMGLNAVRQGVEALRGRLEVASRPGLGSTFRLCLPAMMALEEVVLVRVGAETYAIPQASIDRAGPAPKEAADDIPTLDLRERLQVPGDAAAFPPERRLIVCRRPDGRKGLLVDDVMGRGAVLIKPLPRRARRPGLLGALVTSAGRVVLVLDVDQL